MNKRILTTVFVLSLITQFVFGQQITFSTDYSSGKLYGRTIVIPDLHGSEKIDKENFVKYIDKQLNFSIEWRVLEAPPLDKDLLYINIDLTVSDEQKYAFCVQTIGKTESRFVSKPQNPKKNHIKEKFCIPIVTTDRYVIISNFVQVEDLDVGAIENSFIIQLQPLGMVDQIPFPW